MSQHADGPRDAADPGPGVARPARLRRSPRYPIFIGTGVVVGVVLAVVVNLVAPSSGSTGIVGYLVVVFAAFGAAIGGLVAVLSAIALDRRDRRSHDL